MAEDVKNPDSIDWLVANLVSMGGGMSGMYTPLQLPESAKDEDVITHAFQRNWDTKGHTIKNIVEVRQVHFPHFPEVYKAALLETDFGRKIVLFTYKHGFGGWWSRIYDAPDSVSYKGGGDQIWFWLDFPYARATNQCVAFVQIVSITNESVRFTNSENSTVSDDNGKTRYNLLHVRSGTIVLKVIEAAGIEITNLVSGRFERFQYVPTRDTPGKDPLVQPGARLLVFLEQRDGNWMLASQFYNPVAYLMDRLDYGPRLQGLFKTPLYDEKNLTEGQKVYEENFLEASHRSVSDVEYNPRSN